MKWLALVLAFLCVSSASAFFINTSPDAVEFRQYRFAVNITKSTSHPPTYVTPFNRPANFTMNYTKIPKVLQRPIVPTRHINDSKYDTNLPSTNVRLDPRTCPNDLAICYHVVLHNQTRSTFGKNYSAVSSYLLPGARVHTFFCVGDDTVCTRSATNCFCPTERVNPPPTLHDEGTCDDTTHLCLDTYGSFKLCNGNFSSCSAQYPACGCGKRAACITTKNTCVTGEGRLIICQDAIANCLLKHNACFCGPEVMAFQTGCTTTKHTCFKGNLTVTCSGSFNSCALQFDRCNC